MESAKEDSEADVDMADEVCRRRLCVQYCITISYSVVRQLSCVL